MNSEVNHNSSNYQSTSYFINHPRDLGDKLEHTLAIHTELVDVLKQHGCSNCISLLSDIVRKHNHQVVGPSNDANRLTE
jgi:hypothetical protein